MTPAVAFCQVSRHFGTVRAVDAVDLEIFAGEFFAMLGPSGSGKTTCLRLIAGFEQPTAGHIEIFGETADGVPPYRRNVNTVFQDYALFPHLDVLDNVAYGLMVRGVGKTARLAAAEEALALVQLPGYRERRPSQLSGGQRQRVALARALVKPRVELTGFTPRQSYRLVLFGEKTSLGEVLEPLATEYGADLYLPSGEISDTLLARMARTGAEDGREMVVMVLADCDPAGYQMAISIAHKLRALRETLYACLNFRVLTPALTVEQVKELGLPSTPLKETELRAAGWRFKHGVEQTEIDALATLAPDTLRRIVRDAVAPFYDRSLLHRACAAKSEWEEAAQAAFDEQVDADFLDSIRSQAEIDLSALRERMRELETVVDDIDFDFPPIVMPEPVLDGTPAEPLVSSNMSLFDAIQILRERKRYSGDDGGRP